MSSAAFVLSVQQHGRTSAVSRIQFPDLPSLADFVEKAPPTTDKVGSRGIVGALYSGNQRLNENITQCTAASLDFDKPIDADHFNQVAAVLESEGVGFVAHNTWSNHGRFAVIVPFANPTDLAGTLLPSSACAPCLDPMATSPRNPGGRVSCASSVPTQSISAR